MTRTTNPRAPRTSPVSSRVVAFVGLVSSLVLSLSILACSDASDSTRETPPDAFRGAPASPDDYPPPRIDNSDTSPPGLAMAEGDETCEAETDQAIRCLEEGGCQYASCCVGDPSCCSAPTSIVDLTFESCAGSLGCLSDSFTAFGRPRLREGVLVPGGDLVESSGVFSAAPFDLRVYETVLEVELSPAACEGCLEGAAFGWATGNTTSDARLELASIVYRGNGDDLLFIVSGEVIHSEPRAGRTKLAIRIKPTGDLAFLVDDVVVTLGSARLEPDARIVVYGRNRNPDVSDESAGFGRLTLSRATCGTTRWLDRDALTLSAGASDPSVFDDRGQVLLAYEDGGEGVIAARGEDSFTTLTRWSAETMVRAPDLFRDERTDTLRVVFDDGAALRFGTVDLENAEVTLDAEVEPSFLGLTAPTVASTPSGLALFAKKGDELVAFLRNGWGGVGQEWTTIPTTVINSLLGELGSFDDPELVLHGRAYQLFVSYQRGSRSAIATFASDELLGWRQVTSVALTPSGVAGSFDQIGVSAPTILSRGERLEMYYVGDSGREQQIGWTARFGPMNPVRR